MTATLRRASLADAEAVHRLLVASFLPFQARYTPGCFDATVLDAKRVAARIHEGPMWVVEDHGSLIATVAAKLDQRGLYVRGMAVHPEARRSGLGRRLLGAAAAFGREHDCTAMWLSTTTFLDASQSLYRDYGFVETHGPSHLEGTPLVSFIRPL